MAADDDVRKAETEVSDQEPKLSENVVMKDEIALKEEGAKEENGETKKVDVDEINVKEIPVASDQRNDEENTKEIESILNGNEEEIMKKSEKGECSSSPLVEGGGESCLSNEETGFISDLKGYEKRALMDLKSKLEETILMNKLFKKVIVKEEISEAKKEENEEEESKKENVDQEKEKSLEKGKEKLVVEKDDNIEVEVDKDISLWGVPLLPSKGDERTDVLLYKFLMARDFKANDAFEMLKSTLQWRKENKLDSIMDEDFGNDYDSVGYMKGLDRKGHPVCYNVYGVFADDNMYNKNFGTEESREKFLRWRLRLLEKEIQKLDFGHGGVSELLQVNDLKNTPGPSRRDLRLATKRAVGILQDNYPEFVARNIFINVPFWYYAFNALLSPFLTQRTKSKFVFSRPSRVTDTLLKYIAVEEIPVVYGGLQREDDPEFSTQDAATEVVVKAGATETIEIPAPEVGSGLTWDLTIVGWDVSYKEEYVPTDEGSYTVIVKKERKITWQQESIRNSFVNKEPGKVVITIENGMFKKKKVLYRYKIRNPAASSTAN